MSKEREELKRQIRRLAKEKNAIILAHNYQVPEIQDIADLTGDSLALSIQASKTDADIIVFCGVHFMAEAASIVSPEKRVIIPVIGAGCDMADMLTAEQLRKLKASHPGVPVVTYVNSSAEVKAESDICCTSANAVQVVKWTRSGRVIMTPDRNLADWVRRHTRQEIIAWDGYCPYHDALTVEAVELARLSYPNAVIMAHPECPAAVIDMAHVVRSTSGMLEYAKKSDAEEFIVATEIGLLHTLNRQNPEKRFYPASSEMVCKNMKLIGLEQLRASLEREGPVVSVPEDIRIKAMKAVERMMSVPRD